VLFAKHAKALYPLYVGWCNIASMGLHFLFRDTEVALSATASPHRPTATVERPTAAPAGDGSHCKTAIGRWGPAGVGPGSGRGRAGVRPGSGRGTGRGPAGVRPGSGRGPAGVRPGSGRGQLYSPASLVH